VAPPVGVGESALVTVERQEQLTAPAGQSKILVGGELVDVTLTQASSGVRAAAPADRTPAQVEELQVLATSMISQLQAVLGTDAVLSVSVRTTATGAVIVGLVRDPVTGEFIEVPVEDVVLVSGGGLVLMASGADSQQPAQIGVDGVLEIPQSGQVSVYGGGLTPGADGEVVVMSTPRLISDFSVGATGEVSEQAALPADLELGDHTVVVTAGDEAASLGFRLVAASTQTGRDAEGVATGGTLPATGSDSQQLAWAILLLAMGGLVFMTARRPRRVL
jgi:LPXTG-motif cell wall-anchored protein